MFYKYRHHQPILLRCLQAKKTGLFLLLSCESGIRLVMPQIGSTELILLNKDLAGPIYLMNDNDSPGDLLGSAAQRLTVGVHGEFWPWDIRRFPEYWQHARTCFRWEKWTGKGYIPCCLYGDSDTLLARDLWKKLLCHGDFTSIVCTGFDSDIEISGGQFQTATIWPIFPELVCFWLLPPCVSGIGNRPNWTSPNYWGISCPTDILSSVVQKTAKPDIYQPLVFDGYLEAQFHS